MNIIATTTTVPPTAASGEDISPAAERDLAQEPGVTRAGAMSWPVL